MHTKFWIFLGLHLYMATKRLTSSCPHLAEHATSSFSNCHLFFISKAEHKHLLCTYLSFTRPPTAPHPQRASESVPTQLAQIRGLPSGFLVLPVSGPNPTSRSHGPPTKPSTPLLHVRSRALADGTAERNQKAPSRGLGTELRRN